MQQKHHCSTSELGCQFQIYAGARHMCRIITPASATVACRVLTLCRCCDLLRFCPQVALLLWARAKENLSSAGAAALGKQDMLELACAAVRAASFTVGADGMCASFLEAYPDKPILTTMLSCCSCAVLSCLPAKVC